MKHPALARVFSVVLAILSVVMLAAGHGMIGDARKDYNTANRGLTKASSNLEEYIGLLDENSGKTEYSVMNRELEDRQEAHDEQSADHRTELATYSATRGGIEMGIDALDKADAEFAKAKAEYEKAMAEIEKFDKSYEDYLAAVEAVNQGLAAYEAGEPAVRQAQAVLAGLGAAPPVDESRQALVDAYGALRSSAAMGKATLDALIGFGYPGMDQFAAVMQGIISNCDYMVETLPEEITTEHVEQFMQQNYELTAIAGNISAGLEQMLSETKAQLDATKAQLDAAGPELEKAKAEIDKNRPALEAMGAQIEAGEKALYDSRAQIWWQMGQLEEQAAELEEEKKQLEQDAQDIAELEEKTLDQKAREKRIISLQVGFKTYEGVAEKLEGGMSYTDAVSGYVTERSAANEREYKGRTLAGIIMMVGAFLGLLSIPASYEKSRKRFMLIAPPVLAFLCAAVSEVISVSLERGLLYSSLGVLIFALVHLLVVLPKKPVIAAIDDLAVVDEDEEEANGDSAAEEKPENTAE